jgi:hypothetical protein
MITSTRHIILAVFLSVLAATCPVIANPDPLTDNEWRIYNVNADRKLNVADISKFTGNGGIGFINDPNRDGNKDLTDAFALYVKLSVPDRNCDEAADKNDFIPIDPVQLPEPNAAAVLPLVNRIVTKALTTLLRNPVLLDSELNDDKNNPGDSF